MTEAQSNCRLYVFPADRVQNEIRSAAHAIRQREGRGRAQADFISREQARLRARYRILGFADRTADNQIARFAAAVNRELDRLEVLDAHRTTV